LLICFYLKEKDQKKKTFLGLIIFYVTVSFAVIFPVIGDAPLRYYLQLFFVPFLFVGFFLESIRRRYVKIFMPAMLITCIFFVIANLKTIFSEEQLYASKNHSQPQYVVLGELEDMRDYIMTQTNDALTINMLAEGKYMQNYYKPLLYVLSERNVTLLREQKDMSNIPPNTPLFYVGEKGEYDQSSTINGFTVQQYKNFGEIGIYILNNKK
jgi:ABC-type transport system involved in multi-copper enzyme maturation permease subunit